jgi:hypothetical protein
VTIPEMVRDAFTVIIERTDMGPFGWFIVGVLVGSSGNESSDDEHERNKIAGFLWIGAAIAFILALFDTLHDTDFWFFVFLKTLSGWFYIMFKVVLLFA